LDLAIDFPVEVEHAWTGAGGAFEVRYVYRGCGLWVAFRSRRFFGIRVQRCYQRRYFKMNEMSRL
jgi:hypothetical protein